jgi:hypothetical protein
MEDVGGNEEMRMKQQILHLRLWRTNALAIGMFYFWLVPTTEAEPGLLPINNLNVLFNILFPHVGCPAINFPFHMHCDT